jgi:hypothetical protein
MLVQNNNAIQGKFTTVFKLATFILVVLYLLNCFTPLRMHVDMLRYFAIKDCLELGCPPESAAAKDYLPYGYTGLLFLLSKIGLLKSFVLVFLNCIFLFASLYLIAKIFGLIVRPLFFVMLVLLNWTIIKFVTHPLSEMQYLFFSSVCIYFFWRYSDDKKIFNLLGAFSFAGLAFLTRSVGVVLVAALVAAWIWQFRKELALLISRNKILVSLLFLTLLGVFLFSKQLGLNHYTSVLNKQFVEGATFTRILQWHFTEWAEIGFNVPMLKAVGYLPGSLGKILFILGGLMMTAGFIYAVFIRKNNIPIIIKAYLLFYSLLMFNWPFYDPRFWVPVLPFVAAAVSQLTISSNKAIRVFIQCFVGVYCLMGFLSVAYMTYTSLNKKVFAKTQANGAYRNEYETFFYGKPLSDTATKTDPAILSVLKRYDR